MGVSMARVRKPSMSRTVGRRSRSVPVCSCFDDENRRPALFLDRDRRLPRHRTDIEDAISHMDAADRAYATRSSRIEYCKSKGVDYENVVKYAETVLALNRLIGRGRDNTSLLVTCSENGVIKVEVVGHATDNVFDPLKSRGSRPRSFCPLCLGRDHRLSLCPDLPDELRPFVS
jgi:hypothetical protein